MNVGDNFRAISAKVVEKDGSPHLAPDGPMVCTYDNLYRVEATDKNGQGRTFFPADFEFEVIKGDKND